MQSSRGCGGRDLPLPLLLSETLAGGSDSLPQAASVLAVENGVGTHVCGLSGTSDQVDDCVNCDFSLTCNDGAGSAGSGSFYHYSGQFMAFPIREDRDSKGLHWAQLCVGQDAAA